MAIRRSSLPSWTAVADWRHPDLEPNVWTNEDEIPENGIDDDDNGFIDDIHGVNFANGDSRNNDPTGLSTTPFNARHGTAVAGVAGAVTDNGIGIAGAAWNAKIMHINASVPNTGLRDLLWLRGIDVCGGQRGGHR